MLTPLLLAATVATSQAELVRVSVVVGDKDGRPVTDLAASDFVVLDNGKPQEIVALEGPGHPSPAPAEGAAGAAPSAPTAAAAPGRFIVLAVDDLHVADANMIRARGALLRFVDTQLGDADQVAIVTTSGAGVSRAFTSDRQALRRAVEALRANERRPNAGGRGTMTEAHAEAIERGDTEALDAVVRAASVLETTPQRNPRIVAEVRAQARDIVAQFVQTSAGALRLVESVVRSLQPLPGRKLVILVSDGFLIGPPTDPSTFDLRRLIDASARADVAVYPLDSRGVAGPASSSAAAASSAFLPGQQQKYDRMNELATLDTLGAIADGTGGTFVRGTNDLAIGLDRILRDSAASYLFGYAAPDDGGKRRFHQIEVKVPGRPGLIVRARKGYYSRGDGKANESKETAEARREREIREALAAVAPLRGVPVQLRADFDDQPPDGTQLVLSAHVDLKGLRFETAGGHHKADLELVRVVADESGRVVAAAQGETVNLDLSAASYEKLRTEGIGYQTTVPLAPGRYEARLVVREGRLGQIGSASVWHEIPNTHGAGLALSSVFLSKPSASGAARLEVAQPTRRFARGADLYYGLHVFNPRRAEDGSTEVIVQSQIRRGDALQGVSPVEPVRFAENASAEPVRGRISLEGLAAGAYELRIIAVDKKAGTQAERRIDFSVE